MRDGINQLRETRPPGVMQLESLWRRWRADLSDTDF